MKAVGFCVLLKIAIITTAVISNSIVEKCLTGNKTSLSSELLSTSCCLHNKTDWLVRDSEGQFRCQENRCQSGQSSQVEGFPLELPEGLKCVTDVFEQTVCGEEALGERVFVGEDGVAYCDCDEGWVRFKGRCYQQFTPAFCQGKNEILQLNTKPSTTAGGFLNEEELMILKEGFKQNFSCVENPCPPSSYPHWSTWAEGSEITCHRFEEDMTGCEFVVKENEADRPLACCKPLDRDICFLINQKLIDEGSLHSLAPTGSKNCRAEHIWSDRANRCVRIIA